MAYAPVSKLFGNGGEQGTILGTFTHRETNATFEYTLAEEICPFGEQYASWVWICDGTYRWANVKRTVAYVIVDEAEFNQPVVEKWPLKRHKECDHLLSWAERVFAIV